MQIHYILECFLLIVVLVENLSLYFFLFSLISTITRDFTS